MGRAKFRCSPISRASCFWKNHKHARSSGEETRAICTAKGGGGEPTRNRHAFILSRRVDAKMAKRGRDLPIVSVILNHYLRMLFIYISKESRNFVYSKRVICIWCSEMYVLISLLGLVWIGVRICKLDIGLLECLAAFTREYRFAVQ